LLLLCLGMGLEFLIFPRLWSWMGVGLCRILSQHLMRWSCGFCLWVCLCSELCWWISLYWVILASLGWSLLDHDGWSFRRVLGFGLQEFYWVFLQWYS
jgi:hypothetical protein